MIEINLLPGARRKVRARGGSSLNMGAAFSGAVNRVKDPYLLGTVAAVIAGLGAIGFMYLSQQSQEAKLEERVQVALTDSTKYAKYIKDKKRVEMARDSVLQQLTLIRAIDDKRYVWPHIMDEISRSLPAYTWLTQVVQTNETAPPSLPGPADSADKKLSQAERDSIQAATERVLFRIVGNTVDIQAVTRLYALLEASPFIKNVQLVKSTVVIQENTEVTEFQLDAEYEKPAPGAIRTVPIRLAVR